MHASISSLLQTVYDILQNVIFLYVNHIVPCITLSWLSLCNYLVDTFGGTFLFDVSTFITMALLFTINAVTKTTLHSKTPNKFTS